MSQILALDVPAEIEAIPEPPARAIHDETLVSSELPVVPWESWTCAKDPPDDNHPESREWRLITCYPEILTSPLMAKPIAHCS